MTFTRDSLYITDKKHLSSILLLNLLHFFPSLSYNTSFWPHQDQHTLVLARAAHRTANTATTGGDKGVEITIQTRNAERKALDERRWNGPYTWADETNEDLRDRWRSFTTMTSLTTIYCLSKARGRRKSRATSSSSSSSSSVSSAPSTRSVFACVSSSQGTKTGRGLLGSNGRNWSLLGESEGGKRNPEGSGIGRGVFWGARKRNWSLEGPHGGFV